MPLLGAGQNLVTTVCADNPPEHVMRRAVRTHVMATVGPAAHTTEHFRAMLLAGMTGVRLNFSHSEHKFYESVVANVREASRETGIHCAILGETMGPEIRTGTFENGSGYLLQRGETFTFHSNFVRGTQSQVSVSFIELAKLLQVGDQIKVDYGLVSFTVEDVLPMAVVCTVNNTQRIGQNKIVTFSSQRPGLAEQVDQVRPFLSFDDTRDIDWAVRLGLNYLCLTHVSSAEDIEAVRDLPGVRESGIKLLAKVVKPSALKNIDAVLAASDGLMIARSDLALEIDLSHVANVQKDLIWRCCLAGKPALVTSQLLNSMATASRPTRAEATDVANAVLDGADCLVLTNTTARGVMPVETIAMCREICQESELDVSYRQRYAKMRNTEIQTVQPVGLNSTASVSSSAVKTSWDIQAPLIICFTCTGRAALSCAKYQPAVPILCITESAMVAGQLAIVRACIPVVVPELRNDEPTSREVMRIAKLKGLCTRGELVVSTSGALVRVTETDFLKVMVVE